MKTAITHPPPAVGPSPRLQRKCTCGRPAGPDGQCAECKRKREAALLQRKASGRRESPQPPAFRPQPPLVPPIVHEVLRSSGQPLDPGSRSYMEPRFGHDFSHVRIHADSKANESAQAVNALAYTVGRDIVFARGHAPSNHGHGWPLLAHELTHVVQQGRQSGAAAPRFVDGNSESPAEREAAGVEQAAGRPASPALISAQPGPVLQRKLNVSQPADPIANPTGKGLVQSNAQTVEGYLKTLCSGGSVTVNKASGAVSLAPGFCPTPLPAGFVGPPAPAPADKSKEPTGCNCLCDMVGSAKDYSIVVDDADWPHTSGQVVTAPSPNSPKIWGTATASGKTTAIDPWLVLGHELCGHAWLDEKGLPDNNATRGEGGHQETVARENELRKEHGIEARGSFKDPYCGESFWQDKAGPGPVQWSTYLKTCEAWRQKTYGGKYKISDKIP